MLARVKVRDLPTPALVVDAELLDANLAAMTAALPGARCRPHVKAHKCTELAQRQRDAGHHGFTCATPREVAGMAAAGLGEDLLLANEVLDPDRLAMLAALEARVTVAVDSESTIAAAAAAGLRECLIDVNVGMPRCGCAPTAAGELAGRATDAGIAVRGVMGYEGHVVGVVDRAERVRQTAEAMDLLAVARDAVGRDVVSAGGTGTFDCNELATEIQAGSYALMDTAYDELHLPFRPSLAVSATVISVNQADGFAVADCGLKALGMDHGGPAVEGFTVWFCSDEHVTFSAPEGGSLPAVGARVRVIPAHVDPTVAYHEALHLVAGTDPDAEVLERWAVDLRGW
jgi:D-threonine aldolase